MTLKKRFKASISYTWYLYLLALVLPSICLPFIFSFMHRIREYETLNLFVPKNINSKELVEFLEKNEPTKNVKKYETVVCDYGDSNFLNKLTIVGYSRSDVILLPEKILKNLNIPTVMLEIDEKLKKNYFENEIFYNCENASYGIELDKTKSPLKDFVIFGSEKYFLFLSGNSFNIGEYSKKAPTTSNAFSFTNFLLGN